jgi:hypothetical protein
MPIWLTQTFREIHHIVPQIPMLINYVSKRIFILAVMEVGLVVMLVLVD